jgi:hypothetical protein
MERDGGRPGGADDSWPTGSGKRWGRGGVSGFSGWVAAAVALAAATAGVAVGFFLVRGTSAASAAEAARPAASAPASSGGGVDLPTRPRLPGKASGNGNGQLRILLVGRVLAVSGTSITIGGTGPSVTATINGGTTITGSAHGIGGVKVGDKVAAQITGNASHLVTTTLQDPAQ